MVPVITFCKCRLTRAQSILRQTVPQTRQTFSKSYLETIRQHPQLLLAIAVRHHLHARHELKRLVVLHHDLNVLLRVVCADVLESPWNYTTDYALN